KFVFLRAILDNLYNLDRDNRIDLRDLFRTFARAYWNLVVHHRLRQTDNSHKASAVEIELLKFKAQNNLPEKLNFDKLSDKLQFKISETVFKVCKRYVVGATYGDTNGLFYSFDLKKEDIKFNRSVVHFLKRHKDTVFKLNNYELA